MKKIIISIVMALFFCSQMVYAVTTSERTGEKVIKMTYKEGDKLPLIGGIINNRGAYFEIFSKAAKRTGYKLEVVRLPKKRLHKRLANGELDFYPGASFSEKRAEYLYYIENGLTTGQYGITASGIPEITMFTHVKQQNLIWLMELGSSKTQIAERIGTRTAFLSFVDVDKVQRFIAKNRKIFYVADKELIDYYLARNGYSSLAEVGLKVHKNASGGASPMYMGFSKASPYFRDTINPDYDPSEHLSPTNSPTLIDPDCVAYKFGKALKEMKDSGEAVQIYTKYLSKARLSLAEN